MKGRGLGDGGGRDRLTFDLPPHLPHLPYSHASTSLTRPPQLSTRNLPNFLAFCIFPRCMVLLETVTVTVTVMETGNCEFQGYLRR